MAFLIVKFVTVLVLVDGQVHNSYITTSFKGHKMFGYLWRAIVGRFKSCEHHWEHMETLEITDKFQRPTEKIYILRCSKCGEVKQVRVKAND